MSTDIVQFTDTNWKILDEGVTRFILQNNGSRLKVYIGCCQPDLTADGFDVERNERFAVDGVADFGGAVWVRSISGTGAAIFTAEASGPVDPYVMDDYVVTDYFTP